MLVTSIFSFSHNVLKRILSKIRQKASLCWNGLKKAYQIFKIITLHPTYHMHMDGLSLDLSPPD